MFDCLSKASTEKLLDTLNPRAVLSGHTHHGCLVHHRGKIPGTNCIKIGLPGKSILGDYFQENRTS